MVSVGKIALLADVRAFEFDANTQLNYMEAQKNLPVSTEEMDHECGPCKDLSTVLEEVALKGSLMERLTTLERRVLKVILMPFLVFHFLFLFRVRE